MVDVDIFVDFAFEVVLEDGEGLLDVDEEDDFFVEAFEDEGGDEVAAEGVGVGVVSGGGVVVGDFDF